MKPADVIVSCTWSLLYTCHFQVTEYEEELHMYEYYVHTINTGIFNHRYLYPYPGLRTERINAY